MSESRPVTLGRFEVQSAAVGRDDALDHRQTEPGAGLLGREVAVENAGEVLFLDADPGVGDLNGQVVFVPVRRSFDHAR